MVAYVQSKSIEANGAGTTIAITLGAAVGTGNLICGLFQAGNQSATLTSITDNVSGNTYTAVDNIVDAANNNHGWSFYGKNIVNGPTVITVTFGASHSFRALSVHEVSGCDTTAPLDQHTSIRQTPAPGTGTDAITVGPVTTTANGEYIFCGVMDTTGGHTPPEYTAGTGFTKREESGIAGGMNIASEDLLQTSQGSISGTFTQAANDINMNFIMTFFAAATGIAFDAASNSGDQAASANYTFNRTVTGTNTFLSVDVELLTVTGATVTSVTDDDGAGNIAMTLIGARSTVTGAGRVECWGLANPTSGTKAIRVILSASIESVATAISYTGVHQTSPTEGFNSAQATNAGSANDASVSITSVANNCWIHAACVANDTSITAGQTTRNNVSGTLGSGADEDNNAAVTPAGATTMSYTGMGITTTWAIAGYAIRPIAASNLGNTQAFFRMF